MSGLLTQSQRKTTEYKDGGI